MINTYNLFATPVVHGKFAISPILHKKILTYVEKEITSPTICTRSVINGHQFHAGFDGKEEIDSQLNTFFANNFSLTIEHSWLNILTGNSYNAPHSHGGEQVTSSVVFYLSQNNNNITFVKDDKTFEIKPKLFDYLLFPCELVHYVLPEERPEPRVCYAFNLKPIRKDKNVE